MTIAAVFLDVDGVINDHALNPGMWDAHFGEVLAPVLGGDARAWGKANRAVFPAIWARNESWGTDPMTRIRIEAAETIGAMAEYLGMARPAPDQCFDLLRAADVHIAATAEAAFVKARREVSLSRAALASLTGLPSGTALAGVDAARYDQAARGLALASDEAVSAAASRLAAAAAESDPETASAALASGKAAASVKLAERAWLPGVSAGYSHTVPLGAGESLGLGSGSLSVSASLSLDFWTKKAGLESARLAAGKAAIGLEEAKRKAALGVESAAYDCAALARSLVASAKALEHAESRLEAVRELFALSAASSAELSDAEALAGSARKALVAARFGFISSLSGLGRLAGLEDEELLIAALRG